MQSQFIAIVRAIAIAVSAVLHNRNCLKEEEQVQGDKRPESAIAELFARATLKKISAC